MAGWGFMEWCMTRMAGSGQKGAHQRLCAQLREPSHQCARTAPAGGLSLAPPARGAGKSEHPQNSWGRASPRPQPGGVAGCVQPPHCTDEPPTTGLRGEWGAASPGPIKATSLLGQGSRDGDSGTAADKRPPPHAALRFMATVTEPVGAGRAVWPHHIPMFMMLSFSGLKNSQS